MDAWQLALLIGALVTVGVCWRAGQWKGVAWVGLGAVVFVATAAYERHGGDLLLYLPHPLVSGVADAGIAILAYHVATRNWELTFGYVYAASGIVNLARLLDVVPPIDLGGWIIDPHFGYVALLDLANWAALVVVAANAIGGAADVYPRSRSRLGRLARRGAVALGAKRSSPPFTRIW